MTGVILEWMFEKPAQATLGSPFPTPWCLGLYQSRNMIISVYDTQFKQNLDIYFLKNLLFIYGENIQNNFSSFFKISSTA